MCDINISDHPPASRQSVNIITTMVISHFGCKLRIDTSIWWRELTSEFFR